MCDFILDILLRPERVFHRLPQQFSVALAQAVETHSQCLRMMPSFSASSAWEAATVIIRKGWTCWESNAGLRSRRLSVSNPLSPTTMSFAGLSRSSTT